MSADSFLALQRDLDQLQQKAGGRLSVAVIDLKSSAAAAVDPATPRPMASVAKWVLAHLALVQAARRGQSPFTPIGSEGESLATLCRRAIATHDAAATAQLQAYLPVAAEQELLDELGMGEIQPRTVHVSPENRASARALVRLLWHQVRGEPNPLASEQLQQGMLAQDDPDGIRQGLPADWRAARMTGGTRDAVAEVAVIYLPQGPAAVAALAEAPYDEAIGWFAELGRLIALHLGSHAFG